MHNFVIGDWVKLKSEAHNNDSFRHNKKYKVVSIPDNRSFYTIDDLGLSYWANAYCFELADEEKSTHLPDFL